MGNGPSELELQEEEHAHEKAMKELENECEERRRERQRAHEKEMKELEDKAKKQSREECEKSMKEYDKRIKDNNEKLKKAVATKTSNTQKLNNVDEHIQKFKKYRDGKIESKQDEVSYKDKKKEFERIQMDISKAIKQTCVNQDDVGRVLKLTHFLSVDTASAIEKSNKLAVTLDTFSETVRRDASANLSVVDYFAMTDKERLGKILEEQGFTNMNDLIMDKEDYEEILNELNEELKQNEKPKLKPAEKLAFKNACLKPEKWQGSQKEKQDTCKKTLDAISPTMRDFFERIDVSMKQVTSMISRTGQLTMEQKKAIEFEKRKEKEKERESDKKENDKTDSKEDTVTTNDKESKKDDEDGKKTDDGDGKGLTLMKSLPQTQQEMVKNAEYLERAALAKINVVDEMKEEWNKTDTSHSLCQTIENGCRDIVTTHANISKSLMLIESLAELKPANMTAEGKELWDTIDASVVNIIDTALNVSKVTYQYFAYFIKFRQSFNYYDQNKDK